MTTRTFPVSQSVRRTPHPFPDPPPKEDVNDYLFLTEPGYGRALVRHYGNRDTTAVMAGIYVSQTLPQTQTGLLYPDLLIAFDIDREAIIARKGFVIDEQGKPPDFVLEIGSETTGRRDVVEKRNGYAALGVTEYWRFDPSGGRYHRSQSTPGAALAGDRLVNGQYEPIPIHQTNDGNHHGYSPALNLELRWENGQLLWYDPTAQRYLFNLDEEGDARIAAETQRDTNQAQRDTARSQRDTAEAQRDAAISQRDTAETQRDTAQAERDTAISQRDAAEARIRQLEEQLRRHQNPNPP